MVKKTDLLTQVKKGTCLPPKKLNYKVATVLVFLIISFALFLFGIDYLLDTIKLMTNILRKGINEGMSLEYQLIFSLGIVYVCSQVISILGSFIVKMTEKLTKEGK